MLAEIYKIYQVRIIIVEDPPYCIFCSTVLPSAHCIIRISFVLDEMDFCTAYKNFHLVSDIRFCSYGSKHPRSRQNGCQGPIPKTLISLHLRMGASCSYLTFSLLWKSNMCGFVLWCCFGHRSKHNWVKFTSTKFTFILWSSCKNFSRHCKGIYTQKRSAT